MAGQTRPQAHRTRAGDERPGERAHRPRRTPDREGEGRSPTPVELDKLREDLNSDAPATAALAGLPAFHAVRVRDLSNLLLTDVRDGRLHIGEKP